MWTNTEQELIEGVLRHGPDILDHCLSSDDISQYLNRIDSEHLHYPIPQTTIDSKNWFIPKSYQDMDIEGFLVDNCPKENYERLIQEIQLFQRHINLA